MVEVVSAKEDINEDAYCVLVNIKNFRTYFYFGYLNNPETADTDVGRAYIKVLIKYKI